MKLWWGVVAEDCCAYVLLLVRRCAGAGGGSGSAFDFDTDGGPATGNLSEESMRIMLWWGLRRGVGSKAMLFY